MFLNSHRIQKVVGLCLTFFVLYGLNAFAENGKTCTDASNCVIEIGKNGKIVLVTPRENTQIVVDKSSAIRFVDLKFPHNCLNTADTMERQCPAEVIKERCLIFANNEGDEELQCYDEFEDKYNCPFISNTDENMCQNSRNSYQCLDIAEQDKLQCITNFKTDETECLLAVESDKDLSADERKQDKADCIAYNTPDYCLNQFEKTKQLCGISAE